MIDKLLNTHNRIIPVGIAIYIVVGVLVMKLHYQATGTDVIPNKGFWMSFPFLIKVCKSHTSHPESELGCSYRSIILLLLFIVQDGFLFVISPITKAVRKDKYESF